jgi:hypothetical protein
MEIHPVSSTNPGMSSLRQPVVKLEGTFKKFRIIMGVNQEVVSLEDRGDVVILLVIIQDQGVVEAEMSVVDCPIVRIILGVMVVRETYGPVTLSTTAVEAEVEVQWEALEAVEAVEAVGEEGEGVQ